MMDFLSQSIKEKEEHLECPVCLETAEAPIYTCQEMHLICANCRPKLKECPECRAPYQAQPRRHRSVVTHWSEASDGALLSYTDLLPDLG